MEFSVSGPLPITERNRDVPIDHRRHGHQGLRGDIQCEDVRPLIICLAGHVELGSARRDCEAENNTHAKYRPYTTYNVELSGETAASHESERETVQISFRFDALTAAN